MKTRICSKCGIEKTLDDKSFPKSIRYREGFGTWCKDCHGKASTNWGRKQAKEDPDFHKNNALKNKHHWTPEQYSAKLEEQGGHCALCAETTSQGERISVDHNHDICPGKYACDKCRRGLLCSTCNARLGYLEQTLRDLANPQNGEVDLRNSLAPDSWTRRAMQYLKKYASKTQEETQKNDSVSVSRKPSIHPRAGRIPIRTLA